MILLLSTCINHISDRIIDNGTKEEIASNQLNGDKYTKDIKISINGEIMLENLKNITNNSRRFGTEEEQTALMLLTGKLEEYGYIVEAQEFSVFKHDRKSTLVRYNEDYFNQNPYNTEALGVGTNIIANNESMVKLAKLFIGKEEYKGVTNKYIV